MRIAKKCGLTLIELMVAIAILAMIILIVNGLMVQMVETVRSSQAMIRCNGKARAVGDVLRDDLLTLSRQGLLAIVESPEQNPADRHIGQNGAGSAWPAGDNILFTIGMPRAHSTFFKDQTTGDTATSNEAIINYGVAAAWTYPPDNNNTKVLSGYNILYRNILPTGVEPPWGGSGGYCDFYDFSQSKLNIRGRLSAVKLLMQEPNAFYPYGGMSVPPGSPNGRYYNGDWYKLMMPTASLWGGVFGDTPILAENCTGLTISWSDGSHDADGNLVWHSARNPKNGAWTTRDWHYQRNQLGEDAPECYLDEPAGNYNPPIKPYCAFWTAEKLGNWPLAIKVRYTLKDGRDGVAGLSQVFEAVVDLK